MVVFAKSSWEFSWMKCKKKLEYTAVKNHVFEMKWNEEEKKSKKCFEDFLC